MQIVKKVKYFRSTQFRGDRPMLEAAVSTIYDVGTNRLPVRSDPIDRTIVRTI